jgi:hypothetical protein
MISNSQIQASWIGKSKANANITAVVPAVEIRENSWKGQTFTYPNIRIQLTYFAPNTPDNRCQVFKSKVSFLVFSEIKSSKQADDIAGVVAAEFWGKPFTHSGVKFIAINLEEIVPAHVPEDENSWLSEVKFDCLVQSA